DQDGQARHDAGRGVAHAGQPPGQRDRQLREAGGSPARRQAHGRGLDRRQPRDARADRSPHAEPVAPV
ncbi:MAG: hypothetical protein AVDCRST_MAG30-2914, partial [uncultured Solirubrobacteraceae bacterium]